MNLYVHEHLVATHCQDMQREAEQYRLMAHLPRNHRSVIRHAVGLLGVLLITVGTRMIQSEPRGETVNAW